MCLVTDRDRLGNDVFGYRHGQATERCVWLQTGTGYGTFFWLQTGTDYGTLCLLIDSDRLRNDVFVYRQM